MMSDTRA